MKRNTDEIPADEIRGMRDVLRGLINDSSLEYVIRLAIDVEMQEATMLYNEHRERMAEADRLSRKLNREG